MRIEEEMKNKNRTSQVDRTGKKVYGIALTGLMMALVLVLLYLGSIMPAIDSTFYIFSGVATGIVIAEAGRKNGLMLYIGALLLGFFIVPDKSAVVLYGFIFGIYGFIKYYVEKLNGKLAQLGAKLVFILVDCVILWTFFRTLLLGEATMPTSMILMSLAAVVCVFFIYDYIFTLCIYIYRKKFKHEDIDIVLSASNGPNDKYTADREPANVVENVLKTGNVDMKNLAGNESLANDEIRLEKEQQLGESTGDMAEDEVDSPLK